MKLIKKKAVDGQRPKLMGTGQTGGCRDEKDLATYL